MDEGRPNDYRGDNRNEGRNHNNRNRGNRFRHGSHGGHGGGNHQSRGRVQRPLLTSALNGAGLSFIALVFLQKVPELSMHNSCMGLSVGLFGGSAFVSYIAQRMRPKFIEWVSDLLFLSGLFVLTYLGLKIGGLI